MRIALLTSAICLALTGCVTERTIVGSDKPVFQRKFDADEAATTRITLGLEYLRYGDTTQAKYNLDRALQFAPRNASVHTALAYYYQRVDEPELAKKSYQKALDLDSKNPDTLNNYGVFLCDQKQYPEAEDAFHKAIAIPSYIQVGKSYDNLAICALEQDDFDKAATYLAQAVKHDPANADVAVNFAAVSYAMAEFHHARDVLNRLDSQGYINPRSLLLSYLNEMQLGNIEKARVAKETLQQTYPRSTEATIINDNLTANSEFELLRERYRKKSLRELQQETVAQTDTPKIKIVKRKATGSTSSEQDIELEKERLEQEKLAKERAQLRAKAKRELAEKQAKAAEIEAQAEVNGIESTAVASAQPVMPKKPTAAEKQAMLVEPTQPQTAEQAEQQQTVSSHGEGASPTQVAAALVEQTANTVAQGATTVLQAATTTGEVIAQQPQAKADEAQPLMQKNEGKDLAQGSTTGTESTQEKLPENDSQPAVNESKENQQGTTEQLESKGEELEGANETTETPIEPENEPSVAISAPQASTEPTTVEPQSTPVNEQTSEQRFNDYKVELPTLQQVKEQAKSENPADGVLAAPQQFEEQVVGLDPAPKSENEVGDVTADIASKEQLLAKALEQQSEAVLENNPAASEKLEAAVQTVEQPAPKITQETPFHVVAKGETLYSISVRYNIKMRRLLEWNQLEQNAPLRLGSKVYLANPRVYHTVAAGETLYAISIRYNVLMKKLQEWNNLSEQTALRPGMKLLLVDPNKYAL